MTPRRAAGIPLRLTFERHDWGFAGEAGDAVEGRGYTLRDGERSLSWTSPRLAEAGVVVVKVAGTSYRLDELQDPDFAPGSTLVLRPEPENPHDPNAVGVWTADGTAQAGYVPRDSARTAHGAPEPRGARRARALGVAERRRSPLRPQDPRRTVRSAGGAAGAC